MYRNSHLSPIGAKQSARCPVAPGMGGSFTMGAIRVLTVAFCLLLLVNASFYQLQIAVLDGTAPFPGLMLKIAVVLLVIAAALFRGSCETSALAWPSLLLFGYLAIDMMYLHIHLQRELMEIFVGYNATFSLLFILLLGSSVPLQVDRAALATVVLMTFAICAGLGIVQYTSQLPVLPLQSSDGNFHVLVWQSGFGLRAFSLFTAPGDFGLFSAFVACYAIAHLALCRSSLFFVIVFAAGLYCCYIAGTRSAMISCVLGVITSYLIARRAGRRFLSLLPFLWIAAGIVTAALAYGRAFSTTAQTGLFGTESFGERLLEWRFFVSDLSSREMAELLLGQGIIQSENLRAAFSAIPIDNIYLALILQSGLCGLIAVLMYLVQLWRISLRTALETRSELAIAAAAMLSTLFSAGIFTIDCAPYFLMMFLVFLSESIQSSTTHASDSPRLKVAVS